MKIVVKTLKGTRNEIEVEPQDSVAEVKKKIEAVVGGSVYPAAEQMLIHKGKVLKDETTMEENNVGEKSVIAITLTKGIPEETAASDTCDPKAFYYVPEELLSNESLDFLRHTEQFKILRPVVQSDPRSLKSILEELEKQNPPLFRMIKEKKDEFLRLLRGESIEGGESRNQLAVPKEEVQDKEGGGDGEEREVTPEQYEAIERLEAMGFERSVVMVVYFACNTDEQLAANFLLDHIND